LDISGFFRRIELKFKIAYLYVILGLGVIVMIFILSRTKNTVAQTPAGNIENQQMPNDEVHKGMQSPVDGNPSKSNVSQEVYQRMDKLKKEVEANTRDTIKMREYADFMAAAHRSDEAIIYYEKILKIDSKRNDILFNLSMVYFSRQNYDKAEEYTNRILKNDKNNTQAMYNLGAIAASKGEKERAKVIWNKLVSDYPGDEAAQLAKSSLEKL
jgi:tetratricopeptide (TPR) repeat protein